MSESKTKQLPWWALKDDKAGEQVLAVPVVAHLSLDEQPEAFVELADLQVKLRGYTFACHSSMFAKHSKVMSEMMIATDRSGWADGLATLFKGHQLDNIVLLMALMHGSMSPTATKRIFGKFLGGECDWDQLEDLLRVAHKLEAPQILHACDDYALGQDNIKYPGLGLSLEITTVASELGLHGLRKHGLDYALYYMLTFYEPKNDSELCALDLWEALPFSEYHTLMNAVMKGLKDAVGDRGNKSPSVHRYHPDRQSYRLGLLGL